MTRIPSLERDHYPLLEARLLDRGIVAFHPYDSRRSREGWPDFSIPIGRWLMFTELKATGGELSKAQAGWLLRLRGPWRACLVVDVAALDRLLVIVDNMKAGRLDDLGSTGFRTVVVLGEVKGLAALGADVTVEGGRPVAASAAGSLATPPTPHRPYRPRRPRGS